MARYTFVTESHTFGDDKKAVEILSRSEVTTIAEEAAKEAVSNFARKISAQDRKLAKTAEQAVAAAEDAAAAHEAVARIVETAQETFRDVIAELLAPHYRYLEEHLGIKPPEFENEAEKPSSKLKGRSISVRNTSKHASGGSTSSKGAEDADKNKSVSQKHRRLVVGEKKVTATAGNGTNSAKKMTKTTPPKRKGAKPCPKK